MAKKNKIEDVRTCSMCIHSHSPHELDYKHEPFLCKCPFFKWSRFLYKTMDVCHNFTPRDEYKTRLVELGLWSPYARK